jgi:glutaminase
MQRSALDSLERGPVPLDVAQVQAALEGAVRKARRNDAGQPADYIPQLAGVDVDATSAGVLLCDGGRVLAGDAETHRFSFQSSAKLVVLIGLLEERGPVEVFATVGSEPSGDNFASLARLETHGPLPPNPLVNAGAIALCGQLAGSVERRIDWIHRWAERLYGTRLPIDEAVRESERATADRNRAIAYFLKHNGILTGSVDEILHVYFSLCALTGGVAEACRLPALLANGGVVPGGGDRILSKRTVAITVAIMATCGMYNESGNYLVATGMPAKSGVSGVIVAVAPGRAGVAVASPRLNDKGGSVRGHIMLRELSRQLGWHFALADHPDARHRISDEPGRPDSR